ncbi:MAG: hypothetical protein ACR2O0_04635 [Rhizobiaceae bacterium]
MSKDTYEKWLAEHEGLIDDDDKPSDDLVTPEKYVESMSLHSNSPVDQGQPLSDAQVKSIFHTIVGVM